MKLTLLRNTNYSHVMYTVYVSLQAFTTVINIAYRSRQDQTSLLSRLNVVQKETMWSLILYVVCVCSMCMYVVIFAKLITIRIHSCIPMGLGHNDPWVESHMWPQQMWGQRSSRGQWPLVQVLAKRFTVSTYFDVLSWDLDTMILG